VMRLKPPWEFNNPLCSDAGLDLFYKDDLLDDDNTQSYSEQAKATSLCSSCEHLVDCAEWGINKEKWGIWGGLTPRERHNIRRKRRRRGQVDIEINLLP
jgi:WhiB family redox-sensing transcriptional regulator